MDLTPFPWIDALIIVGLVFLNGLFAMSELAIVSARKAVLTSMEKRSTLGAAAALRLASNPGRFLSTVQIGITLIGILAGAYSGASLGGPVGERLSLIGLEPGLAQTLGFALVIGLTTYASLVIGELVPKQFALRNPEAIAVAMALPMEAMARLTNPVVWLLDRSSAVIFRMLGLRRDASRAVTAEELHMIFAEAAQSGAIEEAERAIMSGVVRLSERPVREVMTPRTEVEWVAMEAEPDELRERLLATNHSRLLLARGSVDDIVGVVQTRDLLAELLRTGSIDLEQAVRRAEIIPDQVDAMDALKMLRKGETDMALVHDEYGHFEGLVTPVDLLSALIGSFASDLDEDSSPHIIERADGSLLLSGATPADIMADRLEIELSDDRDYATAAGHALALLRRLPSEGEIFTDQGWRFEVVDLDGRKIDKLLVSRIDNTPPASA